MVFAERGDRDSDTKARKQPCPNTEKSEDSGEQEAVAEIDGECGGGTVETYGAAVVAQTIKEMEAIVGCDSGGVGEGEDMFLCFVCNNFADLVFHGWLHCSSFFVFWSF